MKMNTGTLICTLLVAAMLSPFTGDHSMAQLNQVNFQHITNSQGLSQSTVNSILRDRQGYMWFGTEDGLNLYDGNNIRVYRHRISDPSSISNSAVWALFEDSRGSIWVGTFNGLNRFDREKDSFESFYHSGDQGSLPDNYVRSIMEDVSGKIWVGTNSGICRLDEQGRVEATYFKGVVINAMLVDRLGKLWVASDDGLWVFDESRDSFSKFSLPEAYGNTSILSFHEDGEGVLWLGTRQHGLFWFDRTRLSFEQKDLLNDQGRLVREVNAITGNHAGTLYVGTNEGLFHYTGKDALPEFHAHSSGNPNSLSDSDIRCIHAEGNGFVWIGTINGGVSLINPHTNRFGMITSGKGRLGNFSNSAIRCISEDLEGMILVGIEEKGLQVYDPLEGKFHEYEGEAGRYLRTRTINCMYVEKEHLWFGVSGEGVLLFNRQSGRFTNLTGQLQEEGDPDLAVQCFEKAANGDMWIGTDGSGLFRYNTGSGEARHYTSDGEPGAIGSNRVFDIMEDSRGQIWLATAGGGLNRYSAPEDRFESFAKDPEDPRRSFNYTLSLAEDTKGDLWIGTFGNGLIRLEQKSGTFSFMMEEEGLPNNFIYSILEDERGMLWLSHNLGLTRFDPVKALFKTFDERDGLQGNEFNANSCYRFSDGKMAFSGINGLNIFHPDSIHANAGVPRIAIRELRIGNREITPGMKSNGREILSTSISTARELQLHHSDREVFLEFAVLDYSVPGKNQYRYRFRGRDKDWIELGTGNHVSFHRFPHRKTVLEVTGSNSFGVWNPEGVSLDIHVKPPFYNTYLFYVLALVLTALGILSAYLRKTRSLQDKNRELAVLVQSKTKEIASQRDALELKNEELEKQNRILDEQRIKTTEMAERLDQANKTRLQFFTNISHEFRTPLSLIIGFTEKLQGDKELSDQEREEDYRLISRNANKLLKLIKRLMHFRKLSIKENRLRISQNDLVSTVREQAILYRNLADQRSVNYIFEAIPESVLAWYDEEQMEEVATNLISNAFKYSANEATIRVRVGLGSDPILHEITGKAPAELEDYIYFLVEDTGQGIPEDKQGLVFKRFYQHASTANPHDTGTGIGLHIASMVVRQHEGMILLKSKVGEGSVFTVLLRAGKEHLAAHEFVEGLEKGRGSLGEVLIEAELESEEPASEFNRTIEKISSQELPEILLIEDNPELRKYIRKGLGDAFSVVEAENDNEAQKALEESAPEIIISDVLLPGPKNGFDIVEGIKSNIHTSHIPVIMLTALDSVDHKVLGLDKGADIYLTKPFSMRELKAHLNRLMESRNVLKQKFREHAFLKSRELEISDKDESFIQKLIRVIEAGMSDPKFNVAVLCEAVNMSQTKLYRKVKALTDITVTDFIRGLRLRKAAAMLMESDKNVSEIAYEVGFNDPNYFGKCFKAQFGCSPSEFVKSNKTGRRIE